MTRSYGREFFVVTPRIHFPGDRATQRQLLRQELKLARAVAHDRLDYRHESLMTGIDNGRRLLDGRSQLLIAIVKPTIEQCRERLSVEGSVTDLFELTLPFIRNVELRLQQLQSFLAELKLQIVRVLQYLQHRQAVFVRPREVSRIKRIAQDVRVPELAIDACRRVVGLLITSRGESRLDDGIELSGKCVGRLR